MKIWIARPMTAAVTARAREAFADLEIRETNAVMSEAEMLRALAEFDIVVRPWATSSRQRSLPRRAPRVASCWPISASATTISTWKLHGRLASR